MASMLRRVAELDSLGELALLEPAECGRVADAVLELRDSWTARSPKAAFFTLGANAYMDLAGAADPHSAYHLPAARANAVLRRHFADVYQVLAAALREAVGMPARYADDLAMPGFHIWTEAGIPRTATSSVHFDLQYRRLLTGSAYARATGTLSFTVPVRLPAAGSSLLLWPGFGYPADIPRLGGAAGTAPVVVEYHLGRAIVHSGHVLHQIGATPTVRPGDLRIMLQGHGLVVDGELILYW
jgi:hypothetical protein